MSLTTHIMTFNYVISSLFVILIIHFVYSASENEADKFGLNDKNNTDPRKPFYVIANMANNITEAENFLTEGANSLQIDIQFSPNGIPKSVHHGFPCTCGRDCTKKETVKDYFEFLRRTSVLGTKHYNPRLALVFINLKLSMLTRGSLYTAGEKLADDVINYLYARGKFASRVWIILGLPDVRTIPFIRGFRDAFHSSKLHWYLERFGYNINRFARPEILKAALLRGGVKGHVWIGTGSSNCKRRSTPQRLIRLATEREVVKKFGNNFVDKIYSWTLDDANAMRESLRLGIDAIITNKPKTLKTILHEAEFEKNIRLADSADVPWRWKTIGEPAGATRRVMATDNNAQIRLALDEIDKELEELDRIPDDDDNGSISDFFKRIFPSTLKSIIDENDNDNEDGLKDIEEDGEKFASKMLRLLKTL